MKPETNVKTKTKTRTEVKVKTICLSPLFVSRYSFMKIPGLAYWAELLECVCVGWDTKKNNSEMSTFINFRNTIFIMNI